MIYLYYILIINLLFSNIEIYIKKNIILLIILETGIGDIFAQNVDTTNFF